MAHLKADRTHSFFLLSRSVPALSAFLKLAPV
jgi:hypothetical protein